ncbi:helix-turn-helix domain-containing protein [Oceanisphaera arctica]|nr:helix-turn-helix domain-containing protein [Oceanisphaera arctica]GHA20258.1 hypothetical protein GCM10007082_21240 [Oceanisphaera arctica]
MSSDVGVRLKAVRTLRNISQRELAKRTGVTHSSLSLIEQGKVSPSVSSLKKILDGIPMTVGEFFTLDLQNTDQMRVLQKGDSYYFSTTQPHRFRNNSDQPCRMVSCSTPAKHF